MDAHLHFGLSPADVSGDLCDGVVLGLEHDEDLAVVRVERVQQFVGQVARDQSGFDFVARLFGGFLLEKKNRFAVAELAEDILRAAPPASQFVVTGIGGDARQPRRE